MPGFVWNSELAKRIAAIWAKRHDGEIKEIQRAWVWDGERAVLWFGPWSFIQAKIWGDLISFTELETILKIYAKSEEDFLAIYDGFSKTEEDRIGPTHQWGALTQFTDLETVIREVYLSEEDFLTLHEGISKSVEFRDQSRQWGTLVEFGENESVIRETHLSEEDTITLTEAWDLDKIEVGPSATPTVSASNTSSCDVKTEWEESVTFSDSESRVIA